MKVVKIKEIKQFPPYVPFKAFKAFIERLHGTAIPPAIDPSLLQNMSGSGRSQLMSCLRFLDLIGSDGSVSDKFRDLIKSYKTDKWASSLSNIIFESYHAIVGDVDLDSGTDSQLVTAFKQRGNVEGQVLEKAKRFYLSALNEAGFKYSPHFGLRKPAMRRPGVTRKSPKKSQEISPYEENDLEEISDDDGKLEQFRFSVKGLGHGALIYPAKMDHADWLKVRQLIDIYFEPITVPNT